MPRHDQSHGLRPCPPAMSTEPPSRVSLDGPSNGLVSQFDLHLRVIADRYLGFFLERSVNHDPRHSLMPTLLFSDGRSKRPSESLSARPYVG